MIKKKYGQDATNVGDEGGFAPNIQVKYKFMLLNGILLNGYSFTSCDYGF